MTTSNLFLALDSGDNLSIMKTGYRKGIYLESISVEDEGISTQKLKNKVASFESDYENVKKHFFKNKDSVKIDSVIMISLEKYGVSVRLDFDKKIPFVVSTYKKGTEDTELLLDIDFIEGELFYEVYFRGGSICEISFYLEPKSFGER